MEDDSSVNTYIVCDVCGEVVCEEKYVGCCNDGLCSDGIEFMCSICGTWNKTSEVWLCPKCLSS